MKKNGLLIGAVIVIALLALGGYVFMNQSKNAPSGSTSQNGSGVVGSIKDALSKSVSLECDYEDSANGTKVQAYIKNGAVRTNFTSSDPRNSGSAIIKDKMMYFWTAQGGFKMAVPETTDATQKTGQPKEEGTTPDSVIQEIEKYKESCKAAIVSDSLFTPPVDVKFQDLSQMMQAAPTGGKTQMPSEEDIEKMMKQYSGQ